MRIYKYGLECVDTQAVMMPKGAEVLSVQLQDGELTAWAKVDTTAKREPRVFRIMSTGYDTVEDGLHYLGTVPRGEFVWHVFEAV